MMRAFRFFVHRQPVPDLSPPIAHEAPGQRVNLHAIITGDDVGTREVMIETDDGQGQPSGAVLARGPLDHWLSLEPVYRYRVIVGFNPNNEVKILAQSLDIENHVPEGLI